ncbi:DNA-binding protein [Duganella qianjiadongensis]|uniref:Integrase n=1 Tax=Duganella qianjiadongensis TaxID=2692176 RepID=A0ABW9VJA9_9BURK|nr:DNA-binding protein [Duganella qianjiadongensis]MYM39673.1 integrase [Duganella qianjiadongensis]
MARSGLYKSEVQKARDALLAKGQRPSIDAVRIELGNTGSKTTIHKYLRELEEEDGIGDQKRTSLSEALTDLVERLAARIQEEADERYATRTNVIEAKAVAQQAAMQSIEAENARLGVQIAAIETANRQNEAALAGVQEALSRESTSRQLAEQEANSLSKRLAENEAHRRSLEEKHQHARDALEHYRVAAKEQREAESRRHELQVQQLQAELRQSNQTLVSKNDEITMLNRDGARFMAELTHTRQALRTAEEHAKRQLDEIERLHAIQSAYEQLSAQMAEREARIAELQGQLASSLGEQEKQSSQVHTLALALAQSRTQVEMQEKMNAQLQEILATGQRPTS